MQVDVNNRSELDIVKSVTKRNKTISSMSPQFLQVNVQVIEHKVQSVKKIPVTHITDRTGDVIIF